MKRNIIFQHDNNFKHKSKSTKEWLHKMNNFLKRPNRSPDLNSIDFPVTWRGLYTGDIVDIILFKMNGCCIKSKMCFNQTLVETKCAQPGHFKSYFSFFPFICYINVVSFNITLNADNYLTWFYMDWSQKAAILTGFCRLFIPTI